MRPPAKVTVTGTVPVPGGTVIDHALAPALRVSAVAVSSPKCTRWTVLSSTRPSAWLVVTVSVALEPTAPDAVRSVGVTRAITET